LQRLFLHGKNPPAISALAAPVKSLKKKPVIRPRLVALALVLVTLVVYLPVRHCQFLVYDDNDYVRENHFVQNGLTWAGVKWAFATWHSSNWHPLTWLSHMLDCELFGLNPGAQHYVNVLFHAANVTLLLLLLFRLTGALWPSAFVAALFAWHPLHVESVAWISERKDVLSTFFGLLSLLAYARYVERSKVQSSTSKVFYGLTLLFFALGLMAKPMLVTLPFVMLLLDYWPLQRFPTRDSASRRSEAKADQPSTALRLTLEKWPFFLLTAASCVVTFLAQSRQSEDTVMALRDFPLDLRAGNALVSYGRYLLKTVWPVDLAVIYPLPGHWTWMQMTAITVGALLSTVSWLVWRVRRKYPWLFVGWFWYLGTLVPVIGLVQVGSQAFADRYTYIPLIGVFIAVTFGVRDLLMRFQIGVTAPVAAAALALGGCLVLTERQLHYWQDSESLFAHAVAVTKDNDIAHLNLGVALEQKGRRKEALAEYHESLRLKPDYAHAHNNLANLLAGMGKTNEALVEYQAAVRLAPDLPVMHDNLGLLLAGLGRFDEAMSQYAAAAKLDPTDPRSPRLMGKALLQQGRDIEAIPHFRNSLRLDPNDFQTLTCLARVLASDENPQVRNGQIALAMAAKANDLTGGIQPVMLDTLAMAYAEIGHFDEAGRAEKQAIKLATAAGLKDDLAGMKQRLQLYESGQPYHQTFTNAPPKN
jgi:tetratricopeptide (TPR) repeat protein